MLPEHRGTAPSTPARRRVNQITHEPSRVTDVGLASAGRKARRERVVDRRRGSSMGRRAMRKGSSMISGKTTLVAHLGYPTFAFKAPLIYNPWFEKNGIDAVVVPMGVQVPDYPDFFRSLFHLTNIRGALVTMPHKVTTIDAGRRADPDRDRSPARPTPCCCARTGRCWATSSTAPGSSAACSARASTLDGQEGARRRQRRCRLADRRLAGRRGRRCDQPVRPVPRRVRGPGGPAAGGLPGARGHAPAPRTRPGTTWSSTPPRWA